MKPFLPMLSRTLTRGLAAGVLAVPVLAVAPQGLELTPVAHAAEQIDLRLKLNKGDVFRQSMDMSQIMDMSVNNQQILTEMFMTFETTTTVVEAKEDGTVRLETVNDHIVAELDDPNGRGVFDSKKPGPLTHPGLAPFAAMVGKTFSYDLSPAGKVSNVEGFEGLIDEILASMQIPDAAKQMMRPIFEKQFTNEAMGQMMEAGHAGYPNKPVAVGDTWDVDQSITGMVPFELESTYTLADQGATTAAAKVEGKLSTPQGAVMEVMPNFPMNLDLSGDQTGEVVYLLENGWIDTMKVQQTLKGTISMPNANNMVMPMAIDTSIELKTLPNR